MEKTHARHLKKMQEIKQISTDLTTTVQKAQEDAKLRVEGDGETRYLPV